MFMEGRKLGKTGIEVSPLVFGGNVFGWTVDEKQSHALLDEMVAGGLTTIDTADSYSMWVPGNSGGESETILGNWLKQSPDRRDKIQIFTKVGTKLSEARGGLSKRWIAEAVEDSLRRLQTDRIDVYFSHFPDPDTPHEETLSAYQSLLDQGKVRAIGASNFDANLLQEALDVADRNNLPRYQVLQPEYNLYDRDEFEGALRDLCQRESIGVVTYFSLASGFLSGKYRSEADAVGSNRLEMVKKYFNGRGRRILAALDEVSASTGAKPAEIALAWLMAQPAVTAPIVSATSSAQLASLFRAVDLKLSEPDLSKLTASAAAE